MPDKIETDRPRSLPCPGHPVSRDSGFGLLLSLLTLAIVSLLGMAVVSYGMADLGISTNFGAKSVAFFVADSGIEQTLVDLTADPYWVDQIVDPLTFALVEPLPDVVTIGDTVITLASGDSGEPEAWIPFGSATDMGGVGVFSREISFPTAAIPLEHAVSLRLPVRSTGVASGISEADATNDATARMTCTAAIRGSLHVIGNAAAPSVVEFSGGADIRNNYDDAAARLGAENAAKLPQLPTTMVDGVEVETLTAEVRLRNASVVLDGSSQIGAPNDGGNGVKETVDAVWTDGEVGPAGQVHVDEWGEYEIDRLSFPTLDDPYYDRVGGVTFPTHREYLDARSMTVAIREISVDVSAFSYSDGTGNAISWDPVTGVLDISGIIQVQGDLRLGTNRGTADDRGFEYRGTGTFYATDDINITGSIVPEGGYIAAGNLGLIAADDVSMAKTAQLNLMAAVYAQGAIAIAKQTSIAGALVADSFDMGNNVPAVFHVPDLPGNLPPGMPGGPGSFMPFSRDIAIVDWYQGR